MGIDAISIMAEEDEIALRMDAGMSRRLLDRVPAENYPSVFNEALLNYGTADQSSEILPPNVAWHSDNKKSFIMWEPPCFRLLQVSYPLNDNYVAYNSIGTLKYEYVVPTPYVLYGINFRSDDTPFVTQILGSDTSPPLDKRTRLYHLPLNNVYEHSGICTHPSTSFPENWNTAQRLVGAISEFWGGSFNNEVPVQDRAYNAMLSASGGRFGPFISQFPLGEPLYTEESDLPTYPQVNKRHWLYTAWASLDLEDVSPYIGTEPYEGPSKPSFPFIPWDGTLQGWRDKLIGDSNYTSDATVTSKGLAQLRFMALCRELM